MNDDTHNERTRSLLNIYNMAYKLNKLTKITEHVKTTIDNIFTNTQDKIIYDIMNGLSYHTSQIIQSAKF